MNNIKSAIRGSSCRSVLRRTGSLASVAIFAVVTLGACSDSGTSAPPPVAVAPTPAPVPTPTPTPTSASFDVSNCLNQTIPGTGFTVAQAVIPDTVTINFAAASGFPNGRRLPDPVVDVTLAILFLDLTRHSPALLAGVPVNPAANDRPFLPGFPYLADVQGTPPIADAGGTSFNFRTDSPAQFVRVDRAGMPAVAPVLIGAAGKNGYNFADPVNDVQGTFVPEITRQLTILTNALADDLGRLGLTPCARPA